MGGIENLIGAWLRLGLVNEDDTWLGGRGVKGWIY